MRTYRTPFVSAALAVLLLVVPGAAFAHQPELALSDFAGQWQSHGVTLLILDDGNAVARWRMYQWCGDPGVVPPCDAVKDGQAVPGGRAELRFSRVAARSAFGTVTSSTDPKMMPVGPVSLTEYDYGIGYIIFDHGFVPPYPMGPQHGITVCGPRYLDAPRWVATWSPCGA